MIVQGTSGNYGIVGESSEENSDGEPSFNVAISINEKMH
jgi:hypothetical protein